VKRATSPRPNGAALTPRMAAVLLEHAGGPRPTRAVVMELRVLRSLWERCLIRFNRHNRPTYTVATTCGRELIAALLASQADVYAGADAQCRPT
jgi:hypothetical protein